MENDKMVVLTQIGNEMQAEILRATLEEAGITCSLISNFDSTKLFQYGKNAVVKVFVPEKDVEAALEIMKSTPTEDLEYGEENDAQ